MVFYDLTSSYFEGGRPRGFGSIRLQPGSAGGKPADPLGGRHGQWLADCPPCLPGQSARFETVLPIVADLEKRFGLRRIVFVGDRGMVSTANLGFLWSQGHGFLFGLRRRRSPEVLEYVRKAQSGSWQPCSPEEKDRVCEVEGALPGQRIFVVESAERLAYEQAMRERDVTKTREELGKLAKRIEKGELRNREEIGSSVARILSLHRSHRYFRWSLRAGKLQVSEEPVETEKLLEGKYVILTEEKDLSPLEAVRAYKELSEVERAFRKLKDVLELRPIYHHNPKRVRAHVFVAALAFLLDRLLEKKLKAANLPFSSEQAWVALRTIHLVDFSFGSEKRRGVTAGNHQARQILSALRISAREP
ncbi:IS1634 family transposase [Methylacidimicrobium sp. AP8]|uniref:IS1634 family transposase n=1 Tax=Methylacidimicrobium sp. AP8 TaxID=2730359 RepID=UPI00351C0CA6